MKKPIVYDTNLLPGTPVVIETPSSYDPIGIIETPDLESLTIGELKYVLRQYDPYVSITGNKRQLIQRLKQYI